MTTTDELKIGTVKWYNDRIGYGFILSHDEPREVFMHKTLLKRCGVEPEPYSQIRYRAYETPKGLMAIYVEPLPDQANE